MILQLRLQQFADSALPIGGAAHSFGIESLVDAGLLDANGLGSFLAGYIEETGALEAAYCAASCELGGAAEPDLSKWLGWNMELAARKLARESRDASAAMGRRFLELAAGTRGGNPACDGFRIGCRSDGTQRRPGGGCFPATVRHCSRILLPTIAATGTNARTRDSVESEASDRRSS